MACPRNASVPRSRQPPTLRAFGAPAGCSRAEPHPPPCIGSRRFRTSAAARDTPQSGVRRQTPSHDASRPSRRGPPQRRHADWGFPGRIQAWGAANSKFEEPLAKPRERHITRMRRLGREGINPSPTVVCRGGVYPRPLDSRVLQEAPKFEIRNLPRDWVAFDATIREENQSQDM